MDETQLMGVGIETSSQFDGFRHDRKMMTSDACPTWWMSATLDDSRLATVDHPKPPDGWPTEKLSNDGGIQRPAGRACYRAKEVGVGTA